MAGSGASPTVYKRQLGMALTTLRESVGKTQDHAAEVLECSPAKIRRIEVGDVAIRAAELRVLLEFYGATRQARKPIEELAREARKRRPRTPYGTVLPDFFRRYFNLEQIATEVLLYHPELVPGQFQTDEYARALIEANPLHNPNEVDRLVEARKARQARLVEGSTPQMQHVVLHEAAIRTVVGGPEVMRAQLHHLKKLSHLTNVTIQVIPFTAGAHAASNFPFILLRFADNQRNIVYLEDLTTANSVDEPGHVAQYETIFRHIVGTALSPAKSMALVTTVAGEL
ncbi:helix-turn-helix domain-containing protein [Saccharothrix obliqua]|uniref:helix-turn-helix domain-containing protein n=1 Tax=Saccharothrix obliqua TaxID=2861747 RepID=UPI001C5FDB98|nr:helix-turn-helix transcriptional regulator [Saccharothrix obliqua]MBW4716921.1 helix-turn-helix domain-containing protein [Saccharothrix obliqua]